MYGFVQTWSCLQAVYCINIDELYTYLVQAIRLAESLMNKGSYGIATFYLSLVESSECLPAHYQLAGELKQIGTGQHVLQ